MPSLEEQKEAQHYLWYQHKLDFLLWEHQKALENKYQEIAARGGGFMFVNCTRRFGKSFWVVKKCIEIALSCKNHQPRIKLGSAFLQDLKEFIIPAFDHVLETKPHDLEVQFKVSEKKYIFPNDSEVLLVGLDLKPNGIRGTHNDLIIFEEAGFIKNLGYLYSSIAKPTTAYRKGAMIIMIGTPPLSPDHPYVEFMEKAKMEDAYIEFTIDDNTMLSDAEKKELLDECLSDTDRLREYYCKVVVDETRAIVPEFNEDKHVVEVEEDELFKFYYKYVCMDLGVVDQTVALFSYYDYKRAKLVILDEMMMQGHKMTTDMLADGIKVKEKQLWGDQKTYLRVADSDNLQLINDLAILHQLPFVTTHKETLEAMVNLVRMWVKQDRVEIAPHCRLLIGCLKTGIWDERRKQFNRSPIYGHYDALAALVYLVRNIDTASNPIPTLLNMSEANMYIPDHLKEAKRKNAHTLEKAIVNKPPRRLK